MMSDTGSPDGDREDSGWLSDSTYELGATMKGTVTHSVDDYRLGDLATDSSVQVKLIDSQVQFAKNQMAEAGYHLNQLSDSVRVLDTRESEGMFSIDYEVSVDMIAKLDGEVPLLEQLKQRHFDLVLPLDPIGVFSQVGTRCSSQKYTANYNYYYYFSPDKDGCDLPMQEASLDIEKVFPRGQAYPEYDQLMEPRRDGTRGFSAALIPSKGDFEPLSTFDNHKRMLENLGLKGVPSGDGRYVRYGWQRGNVRIDVDLFDPTMDWVNPTFLKALHEYQLVVYDGHSTYGTLEFLTSKEAYSDKYQIVLMDSCRSYEYYTRQVFRSKAIATGSEDERRGWANADVVATGGSPTFNFSGMAPREVLRGLLDGMVAIEEGQSADAPSWVDIIREVNANTGYSALFGAAGVRTNQWKPGAGDKN